MRRLIPSEEDSDTRHHVGKCCRSGRIPRSRKVQSKYSAKLWMEASGTTCPTSSSIRFRGEPRYCHIRGHRVKVTARILLLVEEALQILCQIHPNPKIHRASVEI